MTRSVLSPPVLFLPFTHLTRHHLDTLLAFFGSFACFPGTSDFRDQPGLQKLLDQGKISPIFLSPREPNVVDQKARQYLEWARIHRGNEVNLRALLKDNPYFTSDTAVTAIKSQIKGGKSPALEPNASLERDLLFLKMAHLCDEQNESIDLELKRLDKSRDNLLLTLRGLDLPGREEKEGIPAESRDFGEMMTHERIFAWSRCIAVKGGFKNQGELPVFVTTSPAVFDYLESNCTDIVNALDIDGIKVHENECENQSEWQHHFYEGLMTAIQGHGNLENDLPEVTDTCERFGQIKMSLFSGDNINRIFNLTGKQVPVCLIKLK